MTLSARFTDVRSPCGRAAVGARVLDDDQEGSVFEHLTWDCGCQAIHRQYHDGSDQYRVLDHRGRVRTDEHSASHEG